MFFVIFASPGRVYVCVSVSVIVQCFCIFFLIVSLVTLNHWALLASFHLIYASKQFCLCLCQHSDVRSQCVAFKFHQKKRKKNVKHFDHIGTDWIDWNNRVKYSRKFLRGKKMWNSKIKKAQNTTNEWMNEWKSRTVCMYWRWCVDVYQYDWPLQNVSKRDH